MLILSVTLLVAFSYFSCFFYRFYQISSVDDPVNYKYKGCDFFIIPFFCSLILARITGTTNK